MKYFGFVTLTVVLCFASIGFTERGLDNGRWSNRDGQKEVRYIWIAINSGYRIDKVEQSGWDSDGPLHTSASISAEQNANRHSLYAFSSLGCGENYDRYKGFWWGMAHINAPWQHTNNSDTDMSTYKGTVYKTFTRRKSAREQHNPMETCTSSCYAGASISGYHPSLDERNYSVSYVPFSPTEDEIEYSSN